MVKNKQRWAFSILIGLLIMIPVLSLCLGAVPISIDELFQVAIGKGEDTSLVILKYVRLPRICACMLAGCALSVSGCVLQSVLGNRLASPNIIGVNAGAGLGVALCFSFGLFSGWGIALGAFGGALTTALFILVLAKRAGTSKSTVILAGVAMNSILNAARDALASLIPDAALVGNEFRVGGFSSVVSSRLIPASILIGISLIIVLLLHHELDILALGEETALSLGLQVERTRILFLLLAALLAGAAVSFAGLLGFVGLLVPHFSRKIIGNESGKLLLFSGVTGAVFVTGCDLLSRILFAPHELYVGILMAIIGGPCFLIILLKERENNRHA